MKIIDENVQHNLIGKINLFRLTPSQQSPCSQEKVSVRLDFPSFFEEAHSPRRMIIHFFYLRTLQSASRIFFFSFLSFVFRTCTEECVRNFHFIIFIAFDRSVKTDTLCVPLQSFIIFFVLLFTAFFPSASIRELTSATVVVI